MSSELINIQDNVNNLKKDLCLGDISTKHDGRLIKHKIITDANDEFSGGFIRTHLNSGGMQVGYSNDMRPHYLNAVKLLDRESLLTNKTLLSSDDTLRLLIYYVT